MPLDPDVLLAWEFPTAEIPFTETDTILYALGVGLGQDPVDERELAFVYERDLVALPTMTAVLGHPGPWYRDPRLGIDWVHVVQGEQRLEVHAPLAAAGVVRCATRVVDVEDKGQGRGALVRWRRELTDAGTGTPVATLDSTLFCRGDGGFGGVRRQRVPAPPWPDSEPDVVATRATSPRAALIYRLSGDRNPVHVDPKVALEAGFERPILHGLCTFAVACWTVLAAVADGDVDAMASVSMRFRAPVTPGESLRTEMWVDGHTVRFLARGSAPDRVVVDAGEMVLHTAARPGSAR